MTKTKAAKSKPYVEMKLLWNGDTAELGPDDFIEAYRTNEDSVIVLIHRA